MEPLYKGRFGVYSQFVLVVHILQGKKIYCGKGVQKSVRRVLLSEVVLYCRLGVRSLSWNTELVIDGQFHFDLRRGGVAECWLHPQDVLTTLHG